MHHKNHAGDPLLTVKKKCRYKLHVCRISVEFIEANVGYLPSNTDLFIAIVFLPLTWTAGNTICWFSQAMLIPIDFFLQTLKCGVDYSAEN